MSKNEKFDFLYIGDLSRNDANLLATTARSVPNDGSVLEFGVGGSTQIIAQCCQKDVSITSLDTDLQWIELTKQNFKDLSIEKPVDFKPWTRGSDLPYNQSIDLIIDDGLRNMREDFALKSFPLLKMGGLFMLHDTRTPYINVISKLLSTYPLEIESILVNDSGSNWTIVRKCSPRVYRNWNADENKVGWMKGVDVKPEGWLEKLKEKLLF